MMGHSSQGSTEALQTIDSDSRDSANLETHCSESLRESDQVQKIPSKRREGIAGICWTIFTDIIIPVNDVITDWIFLISLISIRNNYASYTLDPRIEDNSAIAYQTLQRFSNELLIPIILTGIASTYGVIHVTRYLMTVLRNYKALIMNNYGFFARLAAACPTLDFNNKSLLSSRLFGTIIEDSVQIFTSLFTLRFASSINNGINRLNIITSFLSICLVWSKFLLLLLEKYIKSKVSRIVCGVLYLIFSVVSFSVGIYVVLNSVGDVCLSNKAVVIASITDSPSYRTFSEECNDFRGIFLMGSKSEEQEFALHSFTIFSPEYFELYQVPELSSFIVSSDAPLDIYGEYYIAENPKLNSITIATKSRFSVGSCKFRVINNPSLEEISFGVSSHTFGLLEVRGNSNLMELNIHHGTTIGDLILTESLIESLKLYSIYLSGNALIRNNDDLLDMRFHEMEFYGEMWIENNWKLELVSFTAMNELYGNFSITASRYTLVNMEDLTLLCGHISVNEFVALNLPRLEEIAEGGSLSLSAPQELSLNLESLSSMDEGIIAITTKSSLVLDLSSLHTFERSEIRVLVENVNASIEIITGLDLVPDGSSICVSWSTPLSSCTVHFASSQASCEGLC